MAGIADVPALDEDAALAVLAEPVLVFAPPLADVAVLYDDMVAAEQSDAVLFHVPYGETSDDDVIRLHCDAHVGLVVCVDGCAGAVVQHVPLRRAGLAYGKRVLAARDRHPGGHGKFFAPRGGPEDGAGLRLLELEDDVVDRAGPQVDDTAAVRETAE